MTIKIDRVYLQKELNKIIADKELSEIFFKILNQSSNIGSVGAGMQRWWIIHQLRCHFHGDGGGAHCLIRWLFLPRFDVSGGATLQRVLPGCPAVIRLGGVDFYSRRRRCSLVRLVRTVEHGRLHNRLF